MPEGRSVGRTGAFASCSRPSCAFSILVFRALIEIVDFPSRIYPLHMSGNGEESGAHIPRGDDTARRPLVEPARSNTDETPRTPSAPDSLPSFNAEVVETCSNIVSEFRTGSISHVEAVSDILRKLGSVPDVPKETYLQAGQVFINMLDSFTRAQRGAENRGRSGATSDAAAGATSAPQAEEAQSSPKNGDSRALVGTKRRRAPSSDSDDDEGGPLFDSKRPLDLSETPWFEVDNSAPLSEPLEKTRRLIVLFAEDPKRWKTLVTNRGDCPQFPDSEWANVLAGRAINLDAVHSSTFSVALDNKHKERLGKLSISFEDVTVAKSVASHGEWLAAWERASRAIAFVFPHRRSELDAYREHVSQLFVVVGSTHQDKVIKYDRGVRARVASRRDLLLTDILQFLDLQTQWIFAVGAGSGDGSAATGGSRSTGRPRKRDPCRRWNDGRCPSSAKDCFWAHVCAKCRSPTHTAGACAAGRA